MASRIRVIDKVLAPDERFRLADPAPSAYSLRPTIHYKLGKSDGYYICLLPLYFPMKSYPA